jgi:hypothetical protein
MAHPSRRSGWNAVATLAVCLGATLHARPATAHDRPFWAELRAHEFHTAPREPVGPLALEAAALLGSTDPQLRDAIAYEALAAWVYRDHALTDPELRALFQLLLTNARAGLGGGESDTLFLRSFSTLSLALFAATDLRQPTLDTAQFDALIDLGTQALTAERDLRGYVPEKGWGHATAHCADLLKFLARSPRLRTAQQRQIVVVIAERTRSAGQVFVWGEDARLASALAAVARRQDLDFMPFSAWFERVGREHEAIWSGPPEPARYVSERAQLNVLAHLAATLDADHTGGAAQVDAALRTLRDATGG